MPEPESRIPGYDLARALALLGMVLVNYTSMLEVHEFSPAWLKPGVDFIFGRAAAVFVVLAGLSVSLMAGRCRLPGDIRALRLRLLKRSLWLLIAGLVLWHWWEADILHFYAVFIAVGAWVMTWRDAHLRLLTAGVLTVSLPVCAFLTTAYDLGDPIFEPGPQHALRTLLQDLATSPYYSVFPWMGFFLAGMLLGRFEPSSASLYRRLSVLGAAACLAMELFSAVLMNWVARSGWEIEGNWWITFLRSEAFPATPLFILSAGAGAVAVIGFCRWAARAALPRIRVLDALTAFGRLSLTLYVAHILWGLLFKSWFSGGPAVTSHQLLMGVAAFDLAGILFAAGWCRHFRRGPLETLFHWLTAASAHRGAAQPMAGTGRGGTPLAQ